MSALLAAETSHVATAISSPEGSRLVVRRAPRSSLMDAADRRRTSAATTESCGMAGRADGTKTKAGGWSSTPAGTCWTKPTRRNIGGAVGRDVQPKTSTPRSSPDTVVRSVASDAAAASK